MLCPSCGTDTPAPFDHCRSCAAPLAFLDSSGNDETIIQRAPSGSSLRIGDTFGRYRILKLLGSGGMGEVYHAWDEELGEAVALKVIRAEFARNADADARFKRELSVARQVTHTNVVRIHDLGIEAGIRYISMPFIEGIDLAHMLSSGRLPLDVALPIARQLAAGLAAAHAAGVVHRDLKPANVMVDRSGRVFLMDFGLARSVEVAQLTQTGMLVGTIDYMSPEQATGAPADHRSDVYTLGLILFELFTGERPFSGDTPMSRLTARLHKAPPDLHLSHPDVPPYLAKIVLRCLERDPGKRYEKVDDIIADLDLHRTAVRRPDWRRLRSWKAVAAALVLIAVVVGYLAYSPAPRVAATSATRAVAAPAVSLAILPFENASGDAALDWLGTSFAEMLGTAVGQSSAVRTVSFGRLQQVLRDLHVRAGAPIDAATLERVAQFDSADTVVSGRYVRVGTEIRVDAVLHDLKRSRTVPLQAAAATDKEVLAVVDRLARAIQQTVASSPDVVKELRSTAFRPSSASAEAMRSYGEGLQLLREGNYQEAAARFETASRTDEKFALAYSQLGLTLASLGRDDEAERASRKAVQLAEGLGTKERYIVQANHARVLNDNAKAIEAYENLAKVSPDDPDIQFTLAGLYETIGALDKAHDLYARVVTRDPKHVEALLAAGRVEIKRGNARAGVGPLNEALSLAIQLENDEEKGRILHAIGMAYTRLNKPSDALRYFQEALAMRRKVGQKNGIAATISQIAEVERLLGKPSEALASYNEALQLQREIGDKRGTATNLLNLASFLADRGRNAEALKMFKESLQIDRDLGDQGGQALCLNNIGTVYFAQGQYDDALTYFQQALQLREQLKVPGDIAETLHNVAESSLKMGQYDQALSQYLRALDLYRAAGNAEGGAIESYAMGKVFDLQGRYGAALAAKSDALKAFRSIGERTFWMVNILGGYGRTLTLTGQGAAADATLDEALALARQLNNPSLVAQILNEKGDRFFYAADYRRAREYYGQAARLATSDREQEMVARLNLAKTDVKDGRAAGALEALKTVEVQANTLGLKHLSLECALYSGEALLQRGESSRARAGLEHMIARSEKLGLGSLLAPAHYLLARTLEKLGLEGEADGHLADARRLAEAIHKETGGDTVLKRSDLAPIFETRRQALATSGTAR